MQWAEKLTVTELPPGLLYEKLYQLCDNKQIRNQNFNKAMPDFDALVSQMIEKKQTSIKECYQEYHAETIAQGKEPISLQYFSARVKRARDKAQESDPDYYYAQQYPYGLYAQLDFTGDQYELNTYNGKVRCWIMAVIVKVVFRFFTNFLSFSTRGQPLVAYGSSPRGFSSPQRGGIFQFAPAALTAANCVTSVIRARPESCATRHCLLMIKRC